MRIGIQSTLLFAFGSVFLLAGMAFSQSGSLKEPAGNSVQGFTESLQRGAKIYHRDTIFKILVARTERVPPHDLTDRHNNERSIKIELPALRNDSKEKHRLLGISFMLAVGDKGKETKNSVLEDYVVPAVLESASFITRNPLVALALGLIEIIFDPPNGKSVKYAFRVFHPDSWREPLTINEGNVVFVSERIEKEIDGVLYLALENDGILTGINVEVEVVAVIERSFKKRPVR